MRLSIILSASNLFTKIRNSSTSGRWKEVLSHYREVGKTGVQVTDHAVFSHILKASLALSFELGKSAHATVIKTGFESFSSVGNSIVDFYAKSGALASALASFNCMTSKDSVSWNIILHGHLDQGALKEGLELYIQARGVEYFEANISTLVLIIQAYRNLRVFNADLMFHGYLIRSALWSITSVQNSLLSMYTEISMDCAENLFDEMLGRDVISWSAMIRGYVHSYETTFSLQLFKQMVSEFDIIADGQTMVSVLKGCTNLGDIRIGELIHGFIVIRGLSYDLFVGNSLIDFYCKCDDVDSAVKTFNEMMPNVNIVSWNSLLCGFINNEKHSEALTLFASMRKSGVDADVITLVTLLLASKAMGDLCLCKSIHARIIKNYLSNELAINSLIDAYGKCNQIKLAQRLFCRIKKPDAITWSTMISCFTHCGMPDEAIAIYRDMRCSLEYPTPVTLLNLLEACAVSAEIKRSKWAHGIAVRMGLTSDVVVGTAILDMYSKCGEIEASRRAFDEIPEKNIVSWSATVAAYGLNGFARDSLALLSEMKLNGMKPNPITILSVLSACCHGGLVEEGLSVFRELAKEHGSELKLEHYSCLVDLLARAGNIDRALEIVNFIPVGASGWGALLSACRSYEKTEFAGAALSQILELEPSSSSGYLLASNIYGTGGSWTAASGMRYLLKENGVKVVPGYSLVYVNDKSYTFTAGDKYQLLSHIIFPIVEQLHLYMKMESDVFPTQFVTPLQIP